MSAPTNNDDNFGPGGSLKGWGSGINGANPEATVNAVGFPPPKGKEYAQNSTTANAATKDDPAPAQDPKDAPSGEQDAQK